MSTAKTKTKTKTPTRPKTEDVKATDLSVGDVIRVGDRRATVTEISRRAAGVALGLHEAGFGSFIASHPSDAILVRLERG